MKTYKLYQIRLTDQEVDMVNDLGHGSVPKQVAKLDMHFAENMHELATEAFDAGYYTHVANIQAENLEDVFRIGNLFKEGQIERLDCMASPSVGDVIVDQNDFFYVIDTFGFTLMSQPSNLPTSIKVPTSLAGARMTS